MKYIKKFESFAAAEPTTKPTTTPTPTTRPGVGRPSPIHRPTPSVTPDPMAKKATEEAIANRFIKLAQAKGLDVKNYMK